MGNFSMMAFIDSLSAGYSWFWGLVNTNCYTSYIHKSVLPFTGALSALLIDSLFVNKKIKISESDLTMDCKLNPRPASSYAANLNSS